MTRSEGTRTERTGREHNRGQEQECIRGWEKERWWKIGRSGTGNVDGDGKPDAIHEQGRERGRGGSGNGGDKREGVRKIVTETGAGTGTKAVAETWTDTRWKLQRGRDRSEQGNHNGERSGWNRRALISATSGKHSFRLGEAILHYP